MWFLLIQAENLTFRWIINSIRNPTHIFGCLNGSQFYTSIIFTLLNLSKYIGTQFLHPQQFSIGSQKKKISHPYISSMIYLSIKKINDLFIKYVRPFFVQVLYTQIHTVPKKPKIFFISSFISIVTIHLSFPFSSSYCH